MKYEFRDLNRPSYVTYFMFLFASECSSRHSSFKFAWKYCNFLLGVFSRFVPTQAAQPFSGQLTAQQRSEIDFSPFFPDKV